MQRGIAGGHKVERNKVTLGKNRVFSRNEVEVHAYSGCKKMMNRFLKNPSKKTYGTFQKAFNSLFAVNPTQAWAIRAALNKEMFNRALKEDAYK